MFSSLSLNSLLETHPIFKSISEIDDDEEPEKTKAYQLVHISSGNFFIWENKRSCLLTSNFRETLNGEKETIQVVKKSYVKLILYLACSGYTCLL